MVLELPHNSNAQPNSLTVAYLVPDQVWMTSVITGIELFYAAQSLHQRRDTPHYHQHVRTRLLQVPGMTGIGFTGLSLTLEPLDDRLFDVIVIPAVWYVTQDHLKTFSELKPWFTEQKNRALLWLGKR